MKIFTKLFLIFCLSFSFVNAQTILVNNNVISVQNDVTFPLWLDSMSTIEIGTQVVSISALEFNIVPANNGNSLVFSQTKTITSQETVPNGMTWKITAILLDSTTLNNSSSNGAGQVIVNTSGLNMPVAISNESSTTVSFQNAVLLCDSLQEDGYDNWVMPTIEEMAFISSGGLVIPDSRTYEYIWTTTVQSGDNVQIIKLNAPSNPNSGQSIIDRSATYNNIYRKVRCVRHESNSISSSGSSSGGSNSASTLGNNMPTMISNESVNTMNFADAMLYCDSLIEFGHSDWILPTLEQISYASSGGCIFNDSRNDSKLWTRTQAATDSGHGNEAWTINLGQNANPVYEYKYTYSSYLFNCRCVR